MKQYILAILVAMLIAGGAIEAQQQSAQQQAQKIVLKPKFFVEDVVFMNNALNTIEISGAEVDAFMSVKNFFKAAVKDIQDNKRSPSDQVEYSVDLESARILLKFLERAKFSGSQAEKYKRFVDAIGDAANNYKKQQEQKQ